MKRILILCMTLASAFWACKDDANEPKYLDNKIIEGTWYCKNGEDSLIYCFGAKTAYYDSYARISGMDELKPEGKIECGRYFLLDSFLLFPDLYGDQKIAYRFSESCSDSLFICSLDYCSEYRRLE